MNSKKVENSVLRYLLLVGISLMSALAISTLVFSPARASTVKPFSVCEKCTYIGAFNKCNVLQCSSNPTAKHGHFERYNCFDQCTGETEYIEVFKFCVGEC